MRQDGRAVSASPALSGLSTGPSDHSCGGCTLRTELEVTSPGRGSRSAGTNGQDVVKNLTARLSMIVGSAGIILIASLQTNPEPRPQALSCEASNGAAKTL